MRQSIIDTLTLNEAQHTAATTHTGPLLCIAGAGTGKTATLTARVAAMIDKGIRPETILLLTFTRKAAQEMLDRASVLLMGKKGALDVAGGTFHSFAHKLLRRHGDAVGLGDGFTILDSPDVNEIIGWQIEDMDIEKDSLPKKDTIRNMFGKAINWGWELQDVLEKEYKEQLEKLELLTELKFRVENYKLWNRLVDFDDLLVYTQKLLERHDGIRQFLSMKYRYIMVDEYQDTNAMQARIVRLLADQHDNVMAVGDDAQSIYAFRGANYCNILEFPQHFPDTQIIPLEENFRSRQPILDMTNVVISQAKDSYDKTLYTSKPGGIKPSMVYCADEEAQSAYIVARIQQLVTEEFLDYRDIAVLFRSSFHAYDLELELNNVRIPFVKVGGLRFMESAHIKDLVAYLRVLVNPTDALAWMRILTLLPNVGIKTARTLIDRLGRQDNPYRYLASVPARRQVREAVNALGEMLVNVFDYYAPAQRVEILMRYYLPILRDKEPSDQEYIRRQQGLDQLYQMSFRYSDTAVFLTELSLDPPNEQSNDDEEREQEQGQEEDRVTLSTIHSAKGLEWKAVFVLWLTEGRFPSLYAYEDEDRIEEELRLLYVAMTRAEDELHLMSPTYYDGRAGMVFSQPTSYFNNVPAELYQSITTGNGHGIVLAPMG